jgi:hypothetical protein
VPLPEQPPGAIIRNFCEQSAKFGTRTKLCRRSEILVRKKPLYVLWMLTIRAHEAVGVFDLRVAALAGRKPTRRPREQRMRHWPESPPTGARRQTSWSTDCGRVTDHSWRLPPASSKMFTFGILYARFSYPVNRQNPS